MTPADIHIRRRALGLSVKQLAYAAAIGKDRIIHIDGRDLARLDAALRVLESGGTVEDARPQAQPGKKPQVSRAKWQNTPPWPAHDGPEKLSGQCFHDAVVRDSGGRVPMRPATVVLQSTTLGN